MNDSNIDSIGSCISKNIYYNCPKIYVVIIIPVDECFNFSDFFTWVNSARYNCMFAVATVCNAYLCVCVYAASIRRCK